MLFLLAASLVPLGALGVVFFFLRTSKDMPKNYKEFKIEVNMQIGGAVALVEDMILRFKNKTGRIKLIQTCDLIYEDFFRFFLELIQKPNKVAIMTGGNRGIGLFVLEKLLKCEMTVMLGVRNPEASRKSIEKALGTDLTKDKLFYEKCDTGDMESVRGFAKKVQEKFKAIHLLINNGKLLLNL